MSQHYFTFGFGQQHENGYHVVEADSDEEARRIMCTRFGNEWAFQYSSREAAGVDMFGLYEVTYKKD
jgi:hypothetical protein